MTKINVHEVLQQMDEYFSPNIIGEINDVFVKLAKIKGNDIPWHNHEKEDEMFFILSGSLTFEIQGESPFEMQAGDMFVVKQGINHRVSSREECQIMLVEKKSTAHTGKVHSEITKSIEEQLGTPNI